MTRILWASNAASVPTGYGNQTNLFTPRLKSAGYDIAIFAYCGIEGAPRIDHNGIPNYPRIRDGYGNDVVQAHYKQHNADLLISLLDVWVCNPDNYGAGEWIAWVPVDSSPVFPANLPSLRAARRIWAMSRFGENELRLAGFTNVDYVPHGVDTSVFTPTNRQDARQRLGEIVQTDLTDRFVVVSNMANKGQPSRKGFFEGLLSFKMFADTHPDAYYYLHTDPFGTWAGENLYTVMQSVGLREDQVGFAPTYAYLTGLLPPRDINVAYNAADVLLHPSHGEGFGIPIIEAQAAGCPVIVTDFSAMRELCLVGTAVPGVGHMYAPGAIQVLPDVYRLVDALVEAYGERDNAERREEARTRAMAYDVDTVFATYMLPAVQDFVNAGAARARAEEQRRTKRRQQIEAIEAVRVTDALEDDR